MEATLVVWHFVCCRHGKKQKLPWSKSFKSLILAEMANHRVIAESDGKDIISLISIKFYYFVLIIILILNKIGNNFSIRQVSIMLGFAERTIWRYLKSMEIRINDKYSTISDEELINVVSKMISENNSLGNVSKVIELFNIQFLNF